MKRTEEEIRKLRSAASTRWNAKNRERCKEYAKAYYANPEVKARKKAEWANMDPIKKAEVLEKLRLRAKGYRDAKKLAKTKDADDKNK